MDNSDYMDVDMDPPKEVVKVTKKKKGLGLKLNIPGQSHDMKNEP